MASSSSADLPAGAGGSATNTALAPLPADARPFEWHDHAALWLSLGVGLLTFILSLLLLQPVKGAVVGFQWALRMHGFDENAPSDIPPV